MLISKITKSLLLKNPFGANNIGTSSLLGSINLLFIGLEFNELL